MGIISVRTLPLDQYPVEAPPATTLKSWREIAEELGLPEGTVYQTGVRAMAKMRRALAPGYDKDRF